MPGTKLVTIPGSLMAFVDQQVKDGGFGSAADYVGHLIRDHQGNVAVDHLRKLIAEGLASGPVIPITKEYWAAKRKKLIG
jgi:antitoxin ParD1/3/4